MSEKKRDKEFEQKKAFAQAVFPYQRARIFKFVAIDPHGKEKSGYVRAKSKEVAIKGLLENSYSIKSVEETQVESAKTMTFVWNPLAVQEAVAIFSRQLLVLYRSGVPLNRAVSILFVQTDEKHMKEALAGMYMDMVKGISFTKSLSRYPHVFPRDYIAMISAGEKSGELAQVLERLADLQEKNLATFRKITSALTYPALVFLFSMTVNYAIFKWVLPSFLDIFDTMGAELPVLTIMIMKIVAFMRSGWFWVFILGFIASFSTLTIQIMRVPQARYLFDGFLLSTPHIGKMIRRMIFIKVFRVFATMLSSGVKISEALRNSAFIAGNEIYRKAFEEMIYKVEKGESLPDCINARKDLFPVIVRQMMTVGDETGEPEITMNLLSDFYETELDQSMEMLSTILEPVMIGMMGVVVGVVVLAVFLPVYGLLNKMI